MYCPKSKYRTELVHDTSLVLVPSVCWHRLPCGAGGSTVRAWPCRGGYYAVCASQSEGVHMLHSAGAWREEWERGCVERLGAGMVGGRNGERGCVEEACRTEVTMVNLPHLKSRPVHHLQRLKQFSVDMQTSLTTLHPCATATRETYSWLSLLSAFPSSENQD